MEIRDTRNGDWHWVYNAVLADTHLTEADKVVYSAISTFGGHQVIHPTLEQIGFRCNVSERQVRYSLKKLEAVDYVKVERSVGRGKANVYYLLKSPKGCKLCPFFKGGKLEQEKGQIKTLKGARTAPHIDKIDKIDNTAFAVLEVKEETPTKRQETPARNQQYEVVLKWAEKRRGFPFVNRVKQYAHLKKARDMGISPGRLKQRWIELEDEVWRNGFDYGSVTSSFDRKA